MISQSFLSLRRDPRILKLPPYLSTACIVVGIAWLLLLPLDRYSRQTYISENALLPGQVHTYFGGSEQNVFRAFKHEVDFLAAEPDEIVTGRLEDIFKSTGLKAARQKYSYSSCGGSHGGENVYSILHAPRGDATEAVVLVAAWRNMDGELNRRGVALLFTLAKYFKRWSLWSKDIIFLIPADSRAGPQAWVDAYHDTPSNRSVAPLTLKSGALQGVIALDYALDHSFESIHVIYDGINGQLPNLDLFNTAVSIASGQMGMGASLQRMWKHGDSYKERLRTMLRGMVSQGLGHASGPHSSFIPYHVDAITLRAVGQGWQDEMALGRSVESVFRSLNNLLEHFHQSFFFYLLMQVNRFVSIGTYLPSAMLVAINFTITAIALWVQSGRHQTSKISAGMVASATVPLRSERADFQVIRHDGMVAMVPKEDLVVTERYLSLPLTLVVGAHFLGAVPLSIFNHNSEQTIATTMVTFGVLNLVGPYMFAIVLTRYFAPSPQQYLLLKSFSLLVLGMFLSALATLNFSLAFLIGLLSTPFTFIPLQLHSRAIAFGGSVILNLASPFAVLYACSQYWNVPVQHILVEAAFGWNVWGMRTQVVVWCVWWPAWLIGTVILASSVVG